MKVLGLITEYNPFHNGHLYHLTESKKLSGADAVVCVMSGNFIQRGEPAIVNKWARAKMALLSGVDLVVELPTVFAMSSAEYFGYGAVKILDSLGVIDSICFGSESGEIKKLDRIAELLHNEPEIYKSLLKAQLSRGISFPAARETALNQYFSQSDGIQEDIGFLTGSSNNILGIEYLKALKKLKSKIIPLTLPRVGNEYNSEGLTGSISSATSVRNYLFTHSMDDTVKNTLPEISVNILQNEFKHGRGPVFSQNFEDLLLCLARRLPSQQIAALPYVSEGLENRIREAAESSGNYGEFIENIVTRRYTRTRIQRIVFSVLTGFVQSDLDMFMEFGGPQYIRILGFNDTGRYLLSQINKNSTLPVIIKTADFKKSCNPLLRRMLELETAATDVYVLGYKNPAFKKAGQEFTQNVVRELLPI